MKTVGIVARTDKNKALNIAAKTAKLFEERRFEVLLESNLANHLPDHGKSVILERMKANLIITIGGDGTILRTSLRIPRPEPPILAIDMGVRGFLTEVQPENVSEAVEKYLNGCYHVEKYTKIASFIGDERLPDALNEVFVTSRHLAKLLNVKIWKDGCQVASCRSDGVIVASQAGSTGYTLSAGGPILDPKLEAFVLTPVCPITFLRPIVFSSKSEVRIDLLKPKTATVVVDGDFQREMKEVESSIILRKSEYESSFIRFDGGFYERLKGRLLFSSEEGLSDE